MSREEWNQGRPHEPLTPDEVEAFLTHADASRDAAYSPEMNRDPHGFASAQARDAFRGYVAGYYARLAATLRHHAATQRHIKHIVAVCDSEADSLTGLIDWRDLRPGLEDMLDPEFGLHAAPTSEKRQ